MRKARTNPLTLWPDEAYEQDVIRQGVLWRPRLLVSRPDVVQRVFVTNTANYRKTPTPLRLLRPMTGNGLLMSDGDEWKMQRRIVAPALAAGTMPLHVRHVAAGTLAALDRLRQAATAPVNLLAAAHLMTLDIAGRSMFSLDLLRHGETIRNAMSRYARKHGRPDLLDMLLPLSVPSPRDFGRRRFNREWMAVMDGIIAERRDAPPSDVPRDLYDLLVGARDSETGQAFTPEQLRDQMVTLILAGHDTTAASLFWSLLMLAQAPVEQERVAQEARQLSFDADAGMATVGALEHTRAVVNETLRLYPAAYRLARQAIGPDRVDDLDIPRGAIVVAAPWLLHRNRRRWPNPDAFDPARFLPGAPPPPRFAYLPFGIGPRVCVGAQLALTELTFALGAIVREFHIERVDQRPVIPVGAVVIDPDHVPLFRLTPR